MGLAHAIAEEQAQLKAVMSDIRLQKVGLRAVQLSVKMQRCVMSINNSVPRSPYQLAHSEISHA